MKKIYAFLLVTSLLLSTIFCLVSCVESIAPDKTFNVVFEVDEETYETQTITEGSYVTEPINPIKSGYTFLGWYNGSQKWRFNFDTVTSNVLLEAKWQVNFKDMFPSYSGLGVDIASDGSYMELDTNPYDIDDFFLSTVLAKIEEANEKLGFSNSLYQKMISTTALQGRQSDSNEYVSVEWTYHPDNGLCVIYEIKK